MVLSIRVLLIICIGVLISGCSGDVFKRAYTASGEGYSEDELRPDAQFSTTDDLNVVVKLGKHDETLTVTGRYLDPNGDVLEVITAEAASDVETVVLGVDFAARSDQGNIWIRGRYRVDVEIDGEVVETLFFRVD